MSADQTTPHHGHPPITMKRIDDSGEIDNVGEFSWQEIKGVRHIYLALPTLTPGVPDNYVMNLLPVSLGANVAGKYWGWDGNEDQPTLTPSVHCIGHWHGWLRGGEMVEA